MPVYKNSKRNSWYCSFYYTDAAGIRKRKKKEGFSTRKAARRYEAEFLLMAGGSLQMSFAQLAELYLQDCQNRCKPTTFYEKEQIIKDKLLPFFGSKPVSDIQVADIRTWQNQLLSHRNLNGESYAATYLYSVNIHLSAVFNYAVRYYGLGANPAALCGNMGSKKAAPMHFWTYEEFQKFLTVLVDNPLAQTAFQLLFWTGIRQGELLALTLEDFDFRENSLNITKNYCRLHKQDLILTPKTPKSTRTIVLPDFLSRMIKDYAIQNLPDYQPGSRLFPVTKYYLSSRLKAACRAAGIREIRVHDLRHSHASLLIELGFSPLLISERLGHEKIETTLQTYSHLYPNKQVVLAGQLNSLYHGTLSVPPSVQNPVPDLK